MRDCSLELFSLILPRPPALWILTSCPAVKRNNAKYQKHHHGETWKRKYQDGMGLLEFARQCCWDQIDRGMFLHEHLATASSCGMRCAVNGTGVYVVIDDMCR